MMTRNEIPDVGSWNIHQLASTLVENSSNLKQVKSTIQTACAWAKYFDKQSNQLIHPTFRCLKESLQVSRIAVSEMSLDLSAIIAALLAPSFLAGWTPSEAIEKRFGHTTASILAELDSLSNCSIQHNTIDIYPHYPDSTAPSIVAALLHICDIIRLHCSGVVLDHQEPLSTTNARLLFELKYFYIPLVHRIRLYDIQTKLADFWLKHTDTINYYAITAQLGTTKLQRQKQLDFITEEVGAVMQKHGIHCTIKKRVKSLYAIWHKMQKLQVGFNQIHDLTAIRIITIGTNEQSLTEEKIVCWKILSIISELYNPLYKIMRDWISMPKDNGYESLHLAFETPQFGQLEVQIRTERMDYIAEYGEAAHWKYKCNG